jgi:putative oxidoreductase
MPFSQSKTLHWIVLGLRLALGVIFVVAACLKLREPLVLFALDIDSYHILPLRMVEPAARFLPWFEMVIGLLLMAGFWLRFSALCVSAMLVTFIAAMSYAHFIMHQDINCGCFGSGEPISWWSMVRDGSMAVASLVLTWMAFVRARPAG